MAKSKMYTQRQVDAIIRSEQSKYFEIGRRNGIQAAKKDIAEALGLYHIFEQKKDDG